MLTPTIFKTSEISQETEEITPQSPLLSLTINTNKESYTVREPITIDGTILKDGSPADDVLIAIEIRDERNNPHYFRTLQIGNPPEMQSVEITSYYIKDTEGNPITKATPKTTIKIGVTVKNKLLNSISPTITITVIDETLTPIFASWTQTSIPPNSQSTPAWLFTIPEWTKPGKLFIFINAYTKLPSQSGIPYIPETTITFDVVRNSEIQPAYTPPITTYTASPGQFKLYLRASPDDETWPGKYNLYSTARITALEITSTQTSYHFSSNDPCPPQAAFTYYPTTVYENMTVTFDASSSSAEGFNDTIIRYEWDFGDGTPKVIKQGTYTNPPDPTVTHKYMTAGDYIVTLNVTDNEGLWSTTSKPITILPEFNPTANFTYTPLQPIVNRTVTFNASASTPGWSAKIGDFSPIIQYIWNFSDGTTISTSNPIATHNFTQPGNYTVTLTVIDSVNRNDTISKIIQVLNLTAKLYDVAPPGGDGKIDIYDVRMTAKHFGTKEGDPDWDPTFDVEPPGGDGKVDIADVRAVARHFGEDP